MGIANIIKIAIVGDEKGLSEATRKANEDLKHLSDNASSHLGKATAISKRALAVIGAGGLAVAGIALKNGDELNESQDQLANAVKNTGGNFDRLQPSLLKAQKAGEKLGFTNRDVNDALTAGTVATGDYDDATQLLAVAQDLAVKKGIPLKDAMIAVAKASEGNLKPLKALGIDLPIAASGAVKLQKAQAALVKAQAQVTLVQAQIHSGYLKGAGAVIALAKANAGLTTAQGNLTTAQSAGRDIVGELGKRIKGSAETATESLGGKTKVLKAKFEDLTAHLGQKLIPIVIQVGTWFGHLVDWFTQNKTAMDAVVVVVGLIVTAMVGLVVIEKVTKFVQFAQKAWGLLNAVMDLNPAVLIAGAIIALGVALFVCYKKVDVFHKAVDGAWQVLQTGFHWVQAHWPLLLAILTGPIGIAVLVIKSHWSAITGGFQKVVGGIQSGVGSIVGFITGLPGRIAGAATSFGSTLLHGILTGLGSAVGAVTDFVSTIATGFKNMVNKFIIDPIRNVDVKWGGFHGIGAFDIHPFGFVPRLHSGGTFMSGNGLGEGLALLRDRERVLTPEQARGWDSRQVAEPWRTGSRRLAPVPGNVIVNLPPGTDPSQVFLAEQRYRKRNG